MLFKKKPVVKPQEFVQVLPFIIPDRLDRWKIVSEKFELPKELWEARTKLLVQGSLIENMIERHLAISGHIVLVEKEENK